MIILGPLNWSMILKSYVQQACFTQHSAHDIFGDCTVLSLVIINLIMITLNKIIKPQK